MMIRSNNSKFKQVLLMSLQKIWMNKFYNRNQLVYLQEDKIQCNKIKQRWSKFNNNSKHKEAKEELLSFDYHTNFIHKINNSQEIIGNLQNNKKMKTTSIFLALSAILSSNHHQKSPYFHILEFPSIVLYNFILFFIEMNQWSDKTKKQNILKAKTKSFKDNLKLSETRAQAGSSMHNLAGQLYSPSKSKAFIPKKLTRSSSVKVYQQNSTSQYNPEHQFCTPTKQRKSKQKMRGLSARVSHVPNFSQMNTQLLIQKKELENRIHFLKQAINREKKLLYEAQKNCSKNKNQLQNYTDSYNENHRKSEKLQQEIDSTKADCKKLTKTNKNLIDNIDQRNRSIYEEKQNCCQWENEGGRLKVSSLIEDKQRKRIRGKLTEDQRVMKSSCKYLKELEDERAHLLLEINQSVRANKI